MKRGIFQRIANRLGFFSRAQVNMMNAGWQAAAINRLTQSWPTYSQSADTEVRQSLTIVRARSRNLTNDNDYAEKFLGMVKSNVIGEYGIQLKNKSMNTPTADYPNGSLDRYVNRVIEDAWYEFGKYGRCTVDRKMSFCDVQNLGIETAARDGELLIRKVRDFDNPANFAIQILDADYLDVNKNEMLADGREIRMGVELNKWKEPIYYWLYKGNPNDTFNRTSTNQAYERVPASDIIHAYLKRRPEQTRGMPWLSTSAYRMNMLGKYEEAEVTAARAAASKMAFLTRSSANVEYTGEEDVNGTIMDAEPGSIEQLPVGMDIKALDWNHPNTSYQVFMKTALRGVAAGLGVSYNSLGNDMESVNFASGKLGLEAERDVWKALQRWYIETVINPIFEEWLEVQLLTQNIRLPLARFDKFNAADWRPRRWAYIDPKAEVSARIDEVKAGFNSISRILAERGMDRDEVFQELSEDYQAAAEMGIDLTAFEDPNQAQIDQAPAEPPAA